MTKDYLAILKVDTRPFVADQSAISPFLGGNICPHMSRKISQWVPHKSFYRNIFLYTSNVVFLYTSKVGRSFCFCIHPICEDPMWEDLSVSVYIQCERSFCIHSMRCLHLSFCIHKTRHMTWCFYIFLTRVTWHFSVYIKRVSSRVSSRVCISLHKNPGRKEVSTTQDASKASTLSSSPAKSLQSVKRVSISLSFFLSPLFLYMYKSTCAQNHCVLSAILYVCVCRYVCIYIHT